MRPTSWDATGPAGVAEFSQSVAEFSQRVAEFSQRVAEFSGRGCDQQAGGRISENPPCFRRIWVAPCLVAPAAVAEFSRPSSSLLPGSSGKLWEALGGSGKLWEALGGSGRLWEALGGSGKLWEALGSFPMCEDDQIRSQLIGSNLRIIAWAFKKSPTPLRPPARPPARRPPPPPDRDPKL